MSVQFSSVEYIRIGVQQVSRNFHLAKLKLCIAPSFPAPQPLATSFLLAVSLSLVVLWCCVVLVAQSCLTLCNPMDGSPPISCLWDSPGKNTGVSCHSDLKMQLFSLPGWEEFPTRPWWCWALSCGNLSSDRHYRLISAGLASERTRAFHWALFSLIFFFFSPTSNLDDARGRHQMKIHSKTQNYLNLYAVEGLRTLCIAKRVSRQLHGGAEPAAGHGPCAHQRVSPRFWVRKSMPVGCRATWKQNPLWTTGRSSSFSPPFAWRRICICWVIMFSSRLVSCRAGWSLQHPGQRGTLALVHSSSAHTGLH